MWEKIKEWLKANIVRSLILFNLLLAAGLSWGLWDKLKEVQCIYIENPPKTDATSGEAERSRSPENATPINTQPPKTDSDSIIKITAEGKTPPPPDKVELTDGTKIKTKQERLKAGEKKTVTFLDVLLLMFMAGGLGGVLCNLRGIFEHYRDEKVFPDRLTTPYYIRPFSAAVCGGFAYFLASFLVSSVTYEAVAVGVEFKALVSYLALAMLAGFGAQEFMERLKIVARSFFGQKSEEDRLARLERYHVLFKAGVLTEVEFQKEKDKILDLPNNPIDYSRDTKKSGD